MIRKDAMQLVVNLGGVLDNTVTKKTNCHMLGNNDYNAILHGEKSSKHKKAVAAVMTAAEHMAFKTRIYGSLYVSENRKYRRNCVVTGFLRCAHTDRVRIQDRVLIEINTQIMFTARWQTMTLIPETAWKTEML